MKHLVNNNVPSIFFKAARHFKSFFVICTLGIFTAQIEKFQLRGNNSVCAAAFKLLRSRAPLQLRRNIDEQSWNLSFGKRFLYQVDEM
jgi:hypothetical protein